MAELSWIQGNFPGYLTPEVSIAALHSGTADDLIRSYDLDMGRVNDVIRAIVDGTVLDMPDIVQIQPGPPDPVTGQPGAAAAGSGAVVHADRQRQHPDLEAHVRRLDENP
jgi:hypothetical protein